MNIHTPPPLAPARPVIETIAVLERDPPVRTSADPVRGREHAAGDRRDTASGTRRP
ncbi:hypothetical protein [Actinomadura formosensis]|uniref:hypothetical protein n=1 Tax=Actinomadura formosensis TaxID=60706 RepID=UPI000AE7F2B6|nr:hypothetical protein [Actinomadura formosensis]